MFKKVYVKILPLFFIHNILYSQPHLCEFQHYTTENGLSSNWVHVILQDSRDFMWFGTDNGLSRFDGYEFVNYFHDPEDSTSLPFSSVSALLEDQNKNLWIVTRGGISLLNRADNSFRNVCWIRKDGARLPVNGEDILESLTGDIYAVGFAGVLKLNPGRFMFEMWTDSITHITEIAETSDTTLWVGTSNGDVYQIDRNIQIQQFQIKDRTARKLITTLTPDRFDGLWIGMAGVGKLFYLDPHKKTTVVFSNNPASPGSFSAKSVNHVFEDSGSNIWVTCVDKGLALFDRKNAKFTYYSHYDLDPGSIASNDIHTLFEDRQGNFWIGLKWKGLDFVPVGSGKRFHTVRSSPGMPNTMINNQVTSFAELPDGRLLVGNDAGGLNLYDIINQKFQTFSHRHSDPYSLISNDVLAIRVDRKNRVWIGCWGGFSQFDVQTGRSVHYKADPGNPRALSDEGVRCIYEDSGNRLWIGTNNGGIDCFDPDLKTFKGHYNKGVLSENGVLCVIEDHQGLLWLGTYNGLIRFDLKINEFSSSLPGKWIYSILEDSRDRLWIGTSTGLVLFDPMIEAIEIFSVRDGLPDNIIYGILEDETGNLWLSTNAGISKLNPQSLTFKNFDMRDGIQGNEFFMGAAFKSRSGELFFGGTEGFTYFRPDEIKHNPFTPPVHITDFRIHYQPVRIGIGGSPIRSAIGETEQITLSCRQNTLSFRYVALNYINSEKNQYAYMLKGLDTDWNNVGTRREAIYTDIRPGKYTFLVKGSNNDGLWNEQGESIDLIIRPPFWKTAWMKGLYFLFILAALVWIRARIIVQEQHRARIENERLNAEKTHEMDQLKLRFLTHLSHEFRTPLTLILGPVEHLLKFGKKIKQEKQHYYYQLIHRNTRRLLRLVNQLMDVRKLDTGRMNLDLQEKELVSFIKAIVSAFRHQAEAKKILFQFHAGFESIHARFDPDKIEKVLVNIISNAVKFTRPEGSIDIFLDKDPELPEKHPAETSRASFIRIQVKDSGPGMAPDQLRNLFKPFYQIPQENRTPWQGSGIGLSLTKELVELHQGTISAESEPGKGTLITVHLPIIGLNSAGMGSESESDWPIQAETIPELPADSPTNAQVRESDRTSPLILIVEDDADFRGYLAAEIRDRYTVIQAADGLAGYGLAVDQIPDLIVCDALMPGLDGYALTLRCKNDTQTSHIPVIMLTAQESKESMKKGLQSGVDDYITKPFDPDLLKIRIDNLLESRRKMRERLNREIHLYPKDVGLNPLDDQLIQKLIEITEQNLPDPDFSVDDLGYHVGLSRSQLYRKMHSLINQTPNDFIQNFRLERAVQLLETGLTASQVAYQTGFSDPSYFSKCFKKRFHQSPAEIKRKNQTVWRTT